MTPHPCCGRSLRSGVKIIAIISLVWTLGLIILEIFLVMEFGLTKGVSELNPEFVNYHYEVIDHKEQQINATNSTFTTTPATPDAIGLFPITKLNTTGTGTPNAATADLTLSIIWIVSWIVDLGFCVLLFNAARCESIWQCMTWFYFRCAGLVLRTFLLVIYTLAGLSILLKLPLIFLLLFRVYSLWVVHRYVGELKERDKELSRAGIV